MSCICDAYPAQHRIDEIQELLAEGLTHPFTPEQLTYELSGWMRARARWQDAHCGASLHLPDQLLASEAGYDVEPALWGALENDTAHQIRERYEDAMLADSHRFADAMTASEHDLQWNRRYEGLDRVRMHRYAELNDWLARAEQSPDDPKIVAWIASRIDKAVRSGKNELSAIVGCIYSTQRRLGVAEPKLASLDLVTAA